MMLFSAKNIAHISEIAVEQRNGSKKMQTPENMIKKKALEGGRCIVLPVTEITGAKIIQLCKQGFLVEDGSEFVRVSW